MAISPDNCRNLTPEERALLNRWEDILDEYLPPKLDDSNKVLYDFSRERKHPMPPKRVCDAICNLYMNAGWKSVRHETGGGDSSSASSSGFFLFEANPATP